MALRIETADWMAGRMDMGKCIAMAPVSDEAAIAFAQTSLVLHSVKLNTIRVCNIQENRPMEVASAFRGQFAELFGSSRISKSNTITIIAAMRGVFFGKFHLIAAPSEGNPNRTWGNAHGIKISHVRL